MAVKAAAEARAATAEEAAAIAAAEVAAARAEAAMAKAEAAQVKAEATKQIEASKAAMAYAEAAAKAAIAEAGTSARVEVAAAAASTTAGERRASAARTSSPTAIGSVKPTVSDVVSVEAADTISWATRVPRPAALAKQTTATSAASDRLPTTAWWGSASLWGAAERSDFPRVSCFSCND